MKNSKKSIINKYYSDIYEVDIIIANKYTTVEQLKKKYTYYDGVIIEDDITKPYAIVAKCKDIKTGKYCILIKFNIDSKDYGKAKLINTLSHESLHATLFIYELIHEDISHETTNEPLCYLTGWISECIYKTVM